MSGFDPQGEYKDGGGLAPEGEAIYQVTTAELKRSRAKKPMIAVEVQLLGGDLHGATVKEWFVLEPRFYAKLKGFCLAIDPKMAGPNSGGLDTTDQDSINEHLVGKALAAEVYHKTRTYQVKGEDKEGTDARFSRDGFRTLTAKERKALKADFGTEDGPELGGFSDDQVPF